MRLHFCIADRHCVLNERLMYVFIFKGHASFASPLYWFVGQETAWDTLVHVPAD